MSPLQLSTFSLAIKTESVGLPPVTFLASITSSVGQFQRVMEEEEERELISRFYKFGAVLLWL